MRKNDPVGRCSNCWMRREACVCEEIPRLELATRIVLVMHGHESFSTTNTGRLAAKAVAGSEVRLWGELGHTMDTGNWTRDGGDAIVLFPSESAVDLEPQVIARWKRPLSLIVLDGTWRQATKMARRVPGLAALPHVKVPDRGPSGYYLRRAPQPHCLGTLEAVARALGALEGPEVEAKLQHLFDEMVLRTLKTRSPDSVKARLLEDLEHRAAPELRRDP